MTPEQWEELIAVFGNLSEDVYVVAARQASIEASLAFAGSIVFTLALVLSCAVGVWLVRRDDDWAFPVAAILLAEFILAFIALNEFFPVFFTYWTNPEWSVLQQLSSLLR